MINMSVILLDTHRRHKHQLHHGNREQEEVLPKLKQIKLKGNNYKTANLQPKQLCPRNMQFRAKFVICHSIVIAVENHFVRIKAAPI